MSPERIAPDRFGFKNSRPTVSSDCYSLGMVVYETISGNVPFHKDTDPAVFMKVVEGKHPPQGVKFTKSLWGMLERCWASGPNNRPSIEDVLRCLEVVSHLPEPTSLRAGEGMDEDGDDWDSATNSSGGDSVDFFTTDDHAQLPPIHSPEDHHLIPGLGAHFLTSVLCFSSLTTATAESGWTPDQTDMYVIPELDICRDIYPAPSSRPLQESPERSIMERLLSDLQQHPLSWPFLQPVSEEEVPDYYDIIKEPMGTHHCPYMIMGEFAHVPGLDFSTMEDKLETNQYSNLGAVVEDAQLVFDNCRIYNPDYSIYSRTATRMEKFMKEKLASYRVKQEY